jgi:hypothetical protein
MRRVLFDEDVQRIVVEPSAAIRNASPGTVIFVGSEE